MPKQWQGISSMCKRCFQGVLFVLDVPASAQCLVQMSCFPSCWIQCLSYHWKHRTKCEEVIIVDYRLGEVLAKMLLEHMGLILFSLEESVCVPYISCNLTFSVSSWCGSVHGGQSCDCNWRRQPKRNQPHQLRRLPERVVASVETLQPTGQEN